MLENCDYVAMGSRTELIYRTDFIFDVLIGDRACERSDYFASKVLTIMISYTRSRIPSICGHLASAISGFFVCNEPRGPPHSPLCGEDGCD